MLSNSCRRALVAASPRLVPANRSSSSPSPSSPSPLLPSSLLPPSPFSSSSSFSRSYATGTSGGAISSSSEEPDNVLLSTRPEIAGKLVVQEFGIVTGSAVHARSFFHDLASRLIGFFGGEVISYSELVNRATKDAAGSMMRAAKAAGANAVVGVKFDISATSDPTAGVFCYSACIGTAVKVMDKEGDDLGARFAKIKGN